MNYLVVGFLVTIFLFHRSNAEEECKVDCPPGDEKVACGFSPELSTYKMFPNQCALEGHVKCTKTLYKPTPIEFCIKSHNKMVIGTRKSSGDESCPVFCPNYYAPVCGASKFRSYVYRTFNNGCYLDMLSCRGEDEELGYEEVPLQFCQRHLMKNIFKEQVIFTGLRDYRDYE